MIEQSVHLPCQGRMLISRHRNAYKDVNVDKVSTGSFFTKKRSWMTPQTVKFIQSAILNGANLAFDPFAGQGHLLQIIENNFEIRSSGCDIKGYQGNYNDSLRQIPAFDNAIIVTNPPYLTNYSAKRKGVYSGLEDYFIEYGDLYQLALANCRLACRFTVAIVPETVLNSRFDKKGFVSVDVILTNPFVDTETPVCVVCIDSQKIDNDFDIYIEGEYACKYSKLKYYRDHQVCGHRNITFNNPKGIIGLKAVDGSLTGDKIRFTTDFDYQKSRIKESSRLMTYIGIEGFDPCLASQLVVASNSILSRMRKDTSDLLLSPFKGNNKDGSRRRRLDYKLARKILIQALKETEGEYGQLRLI